MKSLFLIAERCDELEAKNVELESLLAESGVCESLLKLKIENITEQRDSEAAFHKEAARLLTIEQNKVTEARIALLELRLIKTSQKQGQDIIIEALKKLVR
jgi:hypothetical protein